MDDESWRVLLTEEQTNYVDVLWGKSNHGGRPHLLLQHMFDTAAVAEVMWEQFLSGTLKEALERAAGPGGGKALFSWVCGVHDIGKATPIFQDCVVDLGARVRASGLPFDPRMTPGGWRHDRAGGAHVMYELSKDFGVTVRDLSVEWLWPLIAGHHGTIPEESGLDYEAKRSLGHKQGADPLWIGLRTKLLEILALATGHESLAQVKVGSLPTRGEQLVVSGLVTMADWIASNPRFPAVSKVSEISAMSARQRAEQAWGSLGLAGGWSDLAEPPADVVWSRFGNPPRQVQCVALELASSITAPGLMVVEAPMGEGKTELALAVAEVLASRFGCTGVAVAMPTQATCDAMFDRVQAWLEGFGQSDQLALLHGKRIVNQNWKKLVERATDERTAGHNLVGERVDEFGEPLNYGIVAGICEDSSEAEAAKSGMRAASEWFLGRYRGMLAPHFVGTIDQLLFAATRTKFVSLRFSGLGQKVVIIDEVHAADAYMSEFLEELLAWLGSARVPVVLLSATLSVHQRERLLQAYCMGSDPIEGTLERAGYPQITVAEPNSEGAKCSAVPCSSSRLSQYVALTELVGFDERADAELVSVIDSEVGDGGVALVIRNTVGRAQHIFELLSERYGEDVMLLHSRFSAADRADDTAAVIEKIGAPRRRRDGEKDCARPHRYIVVATQVAEQSFDVDADVLFTDLAPIDLLLQRVGRLHRHERERPASLTTPRVYVSAMPPHEGDGGPLTEPGSTAIYGEHHLLASATLVRDGLAEGWSVPSDVPRLVDLAYGDHPPMVESWRAAADQARVEFEMAKNRRTEVAKAYRLDSKGAGFGTTLKGLHATANVELDVEKHVRVRDAESDSLEVALLRRGDSGYLTLDGKRLGINGEVARSDPSLVIETLIRVPDQAKGALHHAIRESAVMPAEWNDHPWLKHVVALVVDSGGQANVGGYELRYDRRLGLLIERTRR